MGSSSAAESPASNHEEGELFVGAARSAMTNRLLDSLLHDVRNPLNALSINLDVLTEKLRREQGEIPATQEKNLKVMREQIFRVDNILRQFADFIVPRPDTGKPVDVSEVLRLVVGILGHETRRGMIKVRQMIEPDLLVGGPSHAVRFVVLQAAFRAIRRAGEEGEVHLTLQREGDRAQLKIRDGGAPGAEPFPHSVAALGAAAAECGATLTVNDADVCVLFAFQS